MKRFVSSILVVFALITPIAVVFNGCAASSYSKGFDEAD